MSDELASHYVVQPDGNKYWAVYRVRKMGRWEDYVVGGMSEDDAIRAVEALEKIKS